VIIRAIQFMLLVLYLLSISLKISSPYIKWKH